MAIRTFLLIATSALCIAAPLSDAQSKPVRVLGDAALGATNAKVTIVAYLSPTCPACKKWWDRVYTKVDERYVANGKVRFILKETPSSNKPLDAAIFAIARCAGEDQYWKVVDGAYRAQVEIKKAAASAEGPMKELIGLAKLGGIEAGAVTTCIDDSTSARHVASVQIEATARGVTGTPSLFINYQHVPLDDAQSPELFLARVEAALSTFR